jgi:hypothetical protein
MIQNTRPPLVALKPPQRPPLLPAMPAYSRFGLTDRLSTGV